MKSPGSGKWRALIQWFMALDVQSHRHWCKLQPEGHNSGRCEHQTTCWYCTGLLCVNVERKDCPKCASMSDEEKFEASRRKHAEYLEKKEREDAKERGPRCR